MTALLEVSHLVKEYRRGNTVVRAVDDLSMSIAAGEFVSVVGPSGCGKSTLLHMIGGFVPADGGSISCDGRPVTRPGPDRGVIFQSASLFRWCTVTGNITWGLEAQGVERAQREQIADDLLRIIGLQAFRNHYPDELSGGMKQRVALARTLAYDPRLLLMDEPFGALDAQTRELMQEELQKIWDRTRKTVMFVTHDLEEAIYLSDRVLVLTARPGRIKEEITIDLPRPRQIEVKKSLAYLEYRNQLWDLLRSEVLQSVQDTP